VTQTQMMTWTIQVMIRRLAASAAIAAPFESDLARQSPACAARAAAASGGNT
jgi:hypothetical protein